MKKLIRILTAAAALSISSISHAAVIDFDTPTLIEIDNDTGVGTYMEDGFSITGQAASFLTIDGLGVAMTPGLFLVGGETIKLMATNGGLFSFTGLDAASLDTSMATMLDFTGFFGDSTQFSSSVTLGEFANFSFADFDGLNLLQISASGDVVLDNLMVDGGAAQIPEPGTPAMLLLGIGALAGTRRLAKARGKG